jgi:hypothetical protein
LGVPLITDFGEASPLNCSDFLVVLGWRDI